MYICVFMPKHTQVHMRTCTNARMHIYNHTCVFMHIQPCVCPNICIHRFVPTHIQKHEDIYIRIYKYTYAYLYTPTCTIHMHVHMQEHLCIHTYTHTHVCCMRTYAIRLPSAGAGRGIQVGVTTPQDVQAAALCGCIGSPASPPRAAWAKAMVPSFGSFSTDLELRSVYVYIYIYI